MVYCSHLPHTAISRKVVGKSARDNPETYSQCSWRDSCARGTFLTCIPSLLVALPPNQHSTPTLMPPATQATKGIVDSFESTVLQRNLNEWHEGPWTYVCYCWFSHDVTKIQTTKLSILLRFYFHGVLE